MGNHEAEGLHSYDQKRRDKTAAWKFLRKIMKRHGQSLVIVTGKLGSRGTEMRVTGNVDRQETGRRLYSRAENSHLLFRGREQAEQRICRMRCLLNFLAVHASVHNRFNQKRYLDSPENSNTGRAPYFWPVGASSARHKGRDTAFAETGISSDITKSDASRGRVKPRIKAPRRHEETLLSNSVPYLVSFTATLPERNRNENRTAQASESQIGGFGPGWFAQISGAPHAGLSARKSSTASRRGMGATAP